MIDAIIAGLIQGVIELFPLSSTAHLLLIPQLLGLQPLADGFSTAIQAGSALALLFYFARDLFKISITNYILTMLPAVILGFFFASSIKSSLYSLHTMGISLIVGGFVMLIIPQLDRIRSISALSSSQALLIGLMQAVALIPGVSRMGATLIAAQLIGCNRQSAMQFSLMIGIPLLFGATLHDAVKHGATLFAACSPLMIAMGTACITTYLLLPFARKLFNRFGLAPFGIYRILIGIFILYSSI